VGEGQQIPLLLVEDEALPEGVVFINPRCALHTRDGYSVILASGMRIAFFAEDDAAACAYAQVLLVTQGWADQNDVARAFKKGERTVRRNLRRFEEGGLAALGPSTGYPKGRSRVGRSLEDKVLKMRTCGESAASIAFTVGVTVTTVRAILKRRGWRAPAPAQQQVLAKQEPDGTTSEPHVAAEPVEVEGTAPAGEECPSKSRGPGPAEGDRQPGGHTWATGEMEEEPVGFTMDQDPSDRTMDRMFACLGVLEDATPLFGDADAVAGAGALLAVPALVESGVLRIARQVYGSLGPAFYGLRTTIMTLLVMALLRVKRVEGLKEKTPAVLGRLLGLDRAPEVKTLRRKLKALAEDAGRAERFGRALASARVKQREDLVGLLYVDGHVRAYHGEQRLPKTHVVRLGRVLPGTTDYWLNDRDAEPLLHVTAEANTGLVKMVPSLVEEARKVVGNRELTLVFDRGGYSPELFKTLLESKHKVHVMTYHKGHWTNLPVELFKRYEGEVDGRRVTYDLADGEVTLSNRLKLRQVTRRTEDGHQTPILTSRRDLSALEVAVRMFGRWRQENFFKYLREEYALDALVDYGVVEADSKREVPNPARKTIDKTLAKAREDLRSLEAEYGRAAECNQERDRRTMRGFKIANGEIGKKIRDAQQLVAKLEEERKTVAKRVPVGETTDEAIVKLAPERKHLTNVLKMVAFQAETELFHIIGRHYRRSEDEGRTLVQTIFSNPGDLRVSADRLQVIYAPLSAPHRTAVLEGLCAEMTKRQTPYPGTRLKMEFSVRKAA
jgi:transposase